MREDLLMNLQKEVYARCLSPDNQFGMGCYDHIVAVVENGKILAKRYGAEIAYGILKEYHYEESKICLVQECIRNHRGSVVFEKNSVEEVCVADADAISHFDSIPSLLYLAYAQKGLDLEAGKRFVKEKLERSFQKLSSESRKFYQKKYEQAMELLK